MLKNSRELVHPPVSSSTGISGESPPTALQFVSTVSFVLIAAIIICLTLIFGRWTATSVWSFPEFLVAAALLLYFPGSLVLSLTSLDSTPLEFLTLSLAVGLVVSCTLFWIATFVGVSQYFLIWPVAATVLSLYRRPPNLSSVREVLAESGFPQVLLIATIILGIVPM